MSTLREHLLAHLYVQWIAFTNTRERIKKPFPICCTFTRMSVSIVEPVNLNVRGKLFFFDEDDVSEKFVADVALNAKMLEAEDDFEVYEFDDEAPRPSKEEVDANKQKWGM